MNPVDSNSVLNDLVVLHNRSLPVYLSYASPTWHRGDEHAREVLNGIAADHRDTADRLAAWINEHDGVVDTGEFPMYYTGYHDLSFDFLLRQLIQEQEEDVSQIAGCVDKLRLAPLAKALAEEALGAAKGHLQSLQELRSPSSVL